MGTKQKAKRPTPGTVKPNSSGGGAGDTDDFNNYRVCASSQLTPLELTTQQLQAINLEPQARIDGTIFLWSDALLLHKWSKYAIPTPQEQANIIRQAHALNDVYYLLGGFSVTSWLRPEAYNKLIGGAPNSAHILGLATDFIPAKIDVDKAKALIQASGVYPGGGENNSTTWIHLDLKHKTWFTA